MANGCEELEAVTLIDLLRRGGITVDVASLDGTAVTGNHDIRLGVDMNLEQALEQDYDMMVMPGGMPGASNLEEDDRIIRLLRRLADSGKFTGAICAAPKVLAAAGLLEGKRATSFPGFLDAAAGPVGECLEDPVVQDGKVITSRSPGTAMDFALHLVGLLAGDEKRQEVEGRLQRPGL